MWGVIGGVLPLAVGVAISPIPIIAAILMLLSPRARVTAPAFLLGWLAGIVVVTSVFALVSTLVETGASDPPLIFAIVRIVLGMVLIGLAVRQWQRRPRTGQEAALPGWMRAVDGMGFGAGLGLGFVLAALNPKNLLLSASAGVEIGSGGFPVGEAAVVVAIYAVLAGATVIVPVVGYLVAAERLHPALGSVRVWLVDHNAIIMSVLMLVLGASSIGKGIAAF
ncbi:GAP family protein [Homoserinibacter sp. GY 40078]|uniref:GAP family protein n=1 Tax=Homoserinibacter sp. GY 40078 TaxID=2603275 RepID=UPI0011CA8A8F|nr:GAP family protein [Homoserinibacter sp. GY 40078]TXK17850.1 GAP family protein [Homoserinibacter sp. GY 40078]